MQIDARRIGEVLWELQCDARTDLRVPARVFADEALIERVLSDRSAAQLLNVTTLPGIQGYALGMPDMHEGYGFPVGGVAGTSSVDGVISPGGIGFDINCGVRLLATGLSAAHVRAQVPALVHALARSIPTGYGRASRVALAPKVLGGVLARGAAYVVDTLGLGEPDDLVFTESGGSLAAADPGEVSARAKERGHDQLGTLGGGNHFLEVQEVESIHDAAAARAFGLAVGDVTILLHTGSRGLGHQVCTDHVHVMDQALRRRGVQLVDRQLAYAPLASPEGRAYFGAMCAAANFAWANRQVLTERVREVARTLWGEVTLRVVYDVAHNIAKLEDHGGQRLCIHRKGATRAFGPAHPELPDRYRGIGQPIFIPGSMGTASWVLSGEDAASAVSFASTCHGAGRALSRTAAKARDPGHVVRRALEARGITVHCPSSGELAEEAPLAYKDVDHVVAIVVAAGIARKVARLRPLGVLKG